MTTVNLGVFNEITNNKADRDLRNVDLTKTDIVIEYQEPDANDGYKWYRLYASGWVEQGGICERELGTSGTITLPIKMNDNNYTAIAGLGNNAENNTFSISRPEATTTTIKWYKSSTDMASYWIVSGKADMTGHEVLPSKKAIDENDHRVVAFQKPTAENNYTWYRKYADGWVEQGGQTPKNTSGTSVTLSVTMADANYSITCSLKNASSNHGTGGYEKYPGIGDIKTTGFWVDQRENANYYTCWEVKGMAAE